MRHICQTLMVLQLLLAIPTYAEDFISIPSTLFYNKLRFGMTPEMVAISLGVKEDQLVCRDLNKEDVYYEKGLDRKVCTKKIYNENSDNIDYMMYFTNNKLTSFTAIYTPIEKTVDLNSYFNKKVDSLREIIRGANIGCRDKGMNNRRECNFHSSIASINFFQTTYGVLISVRPPYQLADEYERKESNGPTYISIYGLEVGKSSLEDLKIAMVKNNWKVKKKDEISFFKKPNQTTYIIKPQEPSDAHTLIADFEGEMLCEFTYWFVDPYGSGTQRHPVSETNYLKLITNKYGAPYSPAREGYPRTEWRVNRGYRNEVEIATDQSEGLELGFIKYTDVRLFNQRNIQDINKSIADMVKRLSNSKIEL